jgi:hypothetical protein
MRIAPAVPENSLCIPLSIFFAQPPDSRTTKQIPRWWMVEWWRRRASRPHGASGPMPHHRPTIDCEPSPRFHIFIPGQPRIQDYFEILTDVDRCRVTPKKKRFRETRNFFFIVNTMSPVLSGLIDNPISLHQVSTAWRPNCTSPDTVFGNFSTAKRHMSSA